MRERIEQRLEVMSLTNYRPAPLRRDPSRFEMLMNAFHLLLSH